MRVTRCYAGLLSPARASRYTTAEAKRDPVASPSSPRVHSALIAALAVSAAWGAAPSRPRPE